MVSASTRWDAGKQRTSLTNRLTYLDVEETPKVTRGRVVHIRTRCHLSLSGQLSKAEVVKLPLERGKLGVTKVFVEDMRFKLVWIVNFDSPYVNVGMGEITFNIGPCLALSLLVETLPLVHSITSRLSSVSIRVS